MSKRLDEMQAVIDAANEDPRDFITPYFMEPAIKEWPRCVEALRAVLSICEHNPFTHWADKIKMCIERTLEENNDET